MTWCTASRVRTWPLRSRGAGRGGDNRICQIYAKPVRAARVIRYHVAVRPQLSLPVDCFKVQQGARRCRRPGQQV
eukprot:scaffold1640_cov37-Tisochrysis_lutea.AAC.4